jgi:hypothetical protein
MTHPTDPYARGKKAIYYAFLVSPLIYIGLMLGMTYFMGWEALFPFSEVFYLSLVYAFIMLVIPKQMKNFIWQKRKAFIHTPQEFYSEYFAISTTSVSLASGTGVIGLLVYMLSGELILPVGLCLIALFGVYINIPKQAEMDERIKELRFEA